MCIVIGEIFCRQGRVCAVDGLDETVFNFALLLRASDERCMRGISSLMAHSLFSL